MAARYSNSMQKALDSSSAGHKIIESIWDKLLRGEGVSVTYVEPDQSPLYGQLCDTLSFVYINGLDYNLQAPFTHYTTWFINLFMGNFKEFNEEMNTMSETELKKKLLSRETYYQSTSLFHVIEGAIRLHSSSEICSRIVEMRGPSRMEHLQILEKLLEIGADVNARDKRGYTPLHCCFPPQNAASNETALSIAKLLLDKGADINAQCKLGHTVLNCCVVTGKDIK